MASTIIIYEGDGTKTDFTVPFDYLKKSFVTVRLGTGTPLTGGDYGDTGSDYYFLDKTTIRLKVAPSSGETLTIRRYTSATERVVTFKDASILKATDLDTSQLQAFHIAEEGRDILEDSLSVNREENWDAKNKRIVNLADPVGPQDALTKAYYDADSQKVQANRDETEKFMQRAETAVDNAKASEVSASKSEANAKASAGTAVSAAGKTETLRANTQILHDKAVVSASNAKTSETNAKASEVAIKKSEENAKQSAANSKVSETNAGTSADSAQASATEATAQAERAKGYANQAATGQMQADWKEADTTAKSFIKNKPTVNTYSVSLAELQEGTKVTFGHVTAAGVRGAIKKWAPIDADTSGKADKTYVDTGLAEKANVEHAHTIANITNLQTTLDGKQAKGNYATTTALTTGLSAKLDVSVFNAFVDYGDLGEQ